MLIAASCEGIINRSFDNIRAIHPDCTFHIPKLPLDISGSSVVVFEPTCYTNSIMADVHGILRDYQPPEQLGLCV